jgi:hypothetical protein
MQTPNSHQPEGDDRSRQNVPHFSSAVAKRMAALSALGALGALGSIPGWERLYGFTGFFGFFGLAFIVEAVHHARKRKP